MAADKPARAGDQYRAVSPSWLLKLSPLRHRALPCWYCSMRPISIQYSRTGKLMTVPPDSITAAIRSVISNRRPSGTRRQTSRIEEINSGVDEVPQHRLFLNAGDLNAIGLDDSEGYFDIVLPHTDRE